MLMVTDRPVQSRGRLTTRLSSVSEASALNLAQWDELAQLAGEPNAFHEAWFLGPALTHLRGSRDVWIAEAFDESGALCGLLPLSLEPRYGRVPLRHTSNWTHYQCFMGTPLIVEGAETQFWTALITALDASDWAVGFLSISGLLEDGPVHRGLIAAATALDRPSPTVHSYDRAALASDISAGDYLETAVRAKKRKELRRLANRLGDEGTVSYSTLEYTEQLASWCAEFLALESAGWKGARGAALGNAPETAAFFTEIVRGAFAAGRLDFQRLDLDGRAIAMLVNFRTPPGSWSFKIAYDEGLARFSPGVLIELDNLARVLSDPALDWMDSCAVENHPMIDRLWMERRRIIQVSVPLAGTSRRLTYKAARAAETGSASLRRLLRREAW